MLILDQQNLDLKRLMNIQKCHSTTKVDHCAMLYVIAHLKLYNSVDVITHLKSIPLSHTIKISCIHDIQHGQAYRQHKL